MNTTHSPYLVHRQVPGPAQAVGGIERQNWRESLLPFPVFVPVQQPFITATSSGAVVTKLWCSKPHAIIIARVGSDS